MKKTTLVFFVFVLLLTVRSDADAQTAQNAEIGDAAFRAGWNAFMRDSKQTPLKPDERARFHGISWFPILSSYRVTAQFVQTPSAKTFFMPTSSGKPDLYRRLGVVTFTLDHRACRLAAYQREGPEPFRSQPSLFIPFTDKTSGLQSYGGGRYLDVALPNSSRVTLDFNKAYNPYCAYTTGYSCPIPPSENRLPVAVLAGAKAYARSENQP